MRPSLVNFFWSHSCWETFHLRAGPLLKKLQISRIEPTVLQGLVFVGISLISLYFIRENLTGAIAKTGSPYGQSVGLVLLTAGAAVIFLQTAMLDLFLIRADTDETQTQSRSLKVFSSEAWNLLLLVAAPAFVLINFFLFLILLFSQQIEGWSTFEDQLSKMKMAFLGISAWYICFCFFIYLAKASIVGRLTLFANSLSDLKPKVPISLERLAGLDTIGQALNQSSTILSERSRLISGFSKFVSDRLIEKVVSSETFELQGHKTNCAIMMTDLRNFTKLSQNLEPDKVVKMLNIYFEDMISVLGKHGVSIDKFIGDGLLAYVANESINSASAASESMVQASLAMLGQIALTNKKLTSEGLPELRLGIGLHFGEVVLGAMGAQSRMQYTIIGDSVNKTSRIESLCKELGTSLVVSEQLYSMLSTQLQSELSHSTLTSIKGFQEPIKVFYLEPSSDQEKQSA